MKTTTIYLLITLGGLLLVAGTATAESSDCETGDDCEQTQADGGREKPTDTAQAGADCENGDDCEQADSAESGGELVNLNCDIEDVCELAAKRKSNDKSLRSTISVIVKACEGKIHGSRCPLDQVIELCWGMSTSKVEDDCEK